MSGRKIEMLVAVVVAGAALAFAAPAGAQAASSHPAMAKKAPVQQATMKVKESQPGLAAQATVSADSAQKIALSQVPRGRVREAELEDDKGTLVYSYDIKAAGKSGVDEVHVDAKTGAVVSKTHESPKAEAKEAASEKKATSGAKSSSTRSASSSMKSSKSASSKSMSSKPAGSMAPKPAGSMAPKPATKDSTTKP